jgi:hypothetical protein
LALIAGVLLPAHPADAATQLGQTFTPTGNCSPGTRLQVSGLDVPADGVISSWSFERSSSAGSSPAKLKVARPLGGTDVAVIGESELENPAVGLNTFPTRVPVQAGDLLGLYTVPASVFYCSGPAPGFTIGTGPFGSDPPPGTNSTFTASPNTRLSLAVALEPDCDADGFGDESQDPDIASCPPGPLTTITKAPKNRVKTKRKRKRVAFEFTASEPASFECSLDSKPFAPCSPPLTTRSRLGKHSFEIRATDAGGNVGPTVEDTWKVKRKRRK